MNHTHVFNKSRLYLYIKIRGTFGVLGACGLLEHRKYCCSAAQGRVFRTGRALGRPGRAQNRPGLAQNRPVLHRAAQGAPRARPERPRARPRLAQSCPGRCTSPHVRAQSRSEPARGRLCALRAFTRPPVRSKSILQCALARLRLCVRICSSKKLFDKAVSVSTETSFSYTLHSLTRFSFPP